MAISKGKRFDIFRRDNFTCRYCGQRPPDVVLEVDHIHPISKGGTDEDFNLITACYDCNRGKKAKLLSEQAPRPDADLEFLALQQEIAEYNRYLAAKARREDAQNAVISSLQDTWNEYLNRIWVPPDAVFRRWLADYSPEEIDRAIMKASVPFKLGRIQDGIQGIQRYVAGIMKHEREGR
jgi:HNH endonuclease